MGRPRHARVLQHHAASGAHLRERRRRASDLYRVRRTVRDVVSRPRRQVPGTARRDAPAHLVKQQKSAKKALDSGGRVPILRSSFFPFRFSAQKEVIMRSTERDLAMAYEVEIRDI